MPRLLNASKKSGEAFQSLLVRYAVERFLYRLGRSSHQNSFVLKGAMLFVAWGGRPHRLTKDLDFLGFGDPGSVKTELIKEDAEYEGCEYTYRPVLNKLVHRCRSKSALVTR